MNTTLSCTDSILRSNHYKLHCPFVRMSDVAEIYSEKEERKERERERQRDRERERGSKK